MNHGRNGHQPSPLPAVTRPRVTDPLPQPFHVSADGQCIHKIVGTQ
jgi:hypothetical protein